ncbi:sulfur carrier protein ThiS [Neptunicoccus cionae]|uniref:sulfur carrier protein ThiS n=1 Tax=Neptunicoccus cionae TaxID=2035344 RepID=UPI000C76F1D4|nr:sulfur carrier protein ThiS [Amylibacter cionae]PLS21361.1 thiamine biosynthesis protein ThiS [Amylibacter cionae]
MKLQLNGAMIETQAKMLDGLLEEQGFTGAKIATAVNGEFVPASARATQSLSDGDLVEVLAPMQGG